MSSGLISKNLKKVMLRSCVFSFRRISKEEWGKTCVCVRVGVHVHVHVHVLKYVYLYACSTANGAAAGACSLDGAVAPGPHA